MSEVPFYRKTDGSPADQTPFDQWVTGWFEQRDAFEKLRIIGRIWKAMVEVDPIIQEDGVMVSLVDERLSSTPINRLSLWLAAHPEVPTLTEKDVS